MNKNSFQPMEVLASDSGGPTGNRPPNSATDQVAGEKIPELGVAQSEAIRRGLFPQVFLVSMFPLRASHFGNFRSFEPQPILICNKRVPCVFEAAADEIPPELVPRRACYISAHPDTNIHFGGALPKRTHTHTSPQKSML